MITHNLTKSQLKIHYQATKKNLENWTERVTAFREGMAADGRYNLPCPVCQTPIQRIRYAANEANYCPNCQTDGKILADSSISNMRFVCADNQK